MKQITDQEAKEILEQLKHKREVYEYLYNLARNRDPGALIILGKMYLNRRDQHEQLLTE